MTYNEWRDELKNNLLTVTDAERRRVLDYYAEAYADRREAGFTEREIIDGFGAPYDAAQRILYENADDYYRPESARKETRNDEMNIHTSHSEYHYERQGEQTYDADEKSRQQSGEQIGVKKLREDNSWVFVLLCVIFAIPIFCLVMTMAGVTVGLCVAPFGTLISGIVTIGKGIGVVFNNPAAGAMTIGEGIIVSGVGLMLIPLCIFLVKLMWKLFKMFFAWLKGLFSGKEKQQ